MSENDDVARAEEPTDTAETPARDLVQWVGALVIFTGLGLVVAASVGSASLNDTTLRILLLFGTILTAGAETVRLFFGGFTGR